MSACRSESSASRRIHRARVSDLHRLVTPAKIWSRSVVTGARWCLRRFWKHVCVQEREQRVPANSQSARFRSAPASYTGEDLVEISCHGGTLVSAKVLEACLRAGARAARPGEFTERAFLNGKMALTQAEAVIDLIRAKTDLALRSATEQLEGRLGEKIRKICDELVALLAHIQASIDFPEEGIAPDEGERLRARHDFIREEIDSLLATADQGRILRE